MIWLQRFGSGPKELAVESGRYRLIVSPLCPWCRRLTLARRLLGLEEAILVSEAPVRGEGGFHFANDPDPVLKVATVAELYHNQPDWEPGDPVYVPTVMDDHTGRLVSGESNELMRELYEVWTDFHGADAALVGAGEDFFDPDLVELREILDLGIGARLWASIFHSDEAARQEARNDVGKVLGALDPILAQDDYLTGDQPRDVDLRLFTLITSLVEARGREGEDQQTTFSAWPNLSAWYWRQVPTWLTDEECQALGIAR